MIETIRSSLASGLKPELSFDGTGGTYFMKDFNHNKLAVFKPIDEEAYAPNNPRDYVGQFGQPSLRAGVLSGEGVFREAAAYLIDHNGFSNVPPTTLVEAAHASFNNSIDANVQIAAGGVEEENQGEHQMAVQSLLARPSADSSTMPSTDSTEAGADPCFQRKYGSLQLYVDAEDVASNYSYNMYSVDEVHKIAILDLRIFNLDRNDANILVRKVATKNKKGKKVAHFHLIPIDHALSIPSSLKVETYDLCWTEWDQAEAPFSRRSLEFIQGIDYMVDIRRLDKMFKFRPICLRNMRISNMLLKKSALAGLTLAQIISIMCRDPYDEDESPSPLEKMVTKAENMYVTIWVRKPAPRTEVRPPA